MQQEKTTMDNQPDKTKRPQIEMPYAEAVDDSGRCVLCAGEVAQVFDEVIAEHYGVYQNLASDQDGGYVEVFEYKCKACGNESFDGFGNQM